MMYVDRASLFKRLINQKPHGGESYLPVYYRTIIGKRLLYRIPIHSLTESFKIGVYITFSPQFSLCFYHVMK